MMNLLSEWDAIPTADLMKKGLNCPYSPAFSSRYAMCLISAFHTFGSVSYSGNPMYPRLYFRFNL